MRSWHWPPRNPEKRARHTTSTWQRRNWRALSDGPSPTRRTARPPCVDPTVGSSVNTQTLITRLVAACVVLGISACESNPDSASAATAAGSVATKTRGRDSASGRGGRQAPTITLAPGDLATVAKETIEEGTPITGDLNPIETVDV